MNHTFLPLVAFLALVSAVIGLVLTPVALGFFGAAVAAMVILIAAADYAPRRSCTHVAAAVASRESLPFAA